MTFKVIANKVSYLKNETLGCKWYLKK